MNVKGSEPPNPMRRALLPLAVGCLLAALAGCSTFFHVEIEGNDPFKPIFVLKSRSIWQWRAPIGRLMVIGPLPTQGKNEWDYHHPLWEIAVPQNDSRLIRKVEYGIAPAGFAEIKHADKLVQNIHYLIGGSGPGIVGSGEFVIREDKGVMKAVVIPKDRGVRND